MKPLLHRRTFWKGVVSGAAALARNTLFAAVMVAFVSLGRWLGMKEEDE